MDTNWDVECVAGRSRTWDSDGGEAGMRATCSGGEEDWVDILRKEREVSWGRTILAGEGTIDQETADCLRLLRVPPSPGGCSRGY